MKYGPALFAVVVVLVVYNWAVGPVLSLAWNGVETTGTITAKETIRIHSRKGSSRNRTEITVDAGELELVVKNASPSLRKGRDVHVVYHPDDRSVNAVGTFAKGKFAFVWDALGTMGILFGLFATVTFTIWYRSWLRTQDDS